MYTEFYGLVERPFEMTPDARYVYLSAHHREALAHLKYGVEDRKGFIQLTGEVGTGKTTMLDVLAHELDASTAVAKLSYTTIDELDLLRVLAGGFGIDTTACSKASILELLQERLSAWSDDSKNAIFIVDEAQNLSLPVLEEIRLLSNLRANGMLSLQIVLAGQPELRDKLEMKELRQLRQRIGIRYHLTPLSSEETAEYIAHRMAVAGATQRVFQPDAVDVVYEYSKGVPRVINMVCDRALLAGYARNSARVTADIVYEAIDGLEGGGEDASGPVAWEPEVEATVMPKVRRPASRRMPWAPAVAASIAVVAIVVGAVFYFEGREGADLSSGELAVAATGAETDTLETMMGVSEGEPTPNETVRGPEAVDVDAERTTDVVGTTAEDEVAPVLVTDTPVGETRIDAAPTGPYVIVASSSRNLAAARRHAEELRGDGMNASVWTVDLGERGTWHRVVLDAGFDSLASARRAVEVLQRSGLPDAWVARR